MHQETKGFIKELLIYFIWVFIAMVVITVAMNIVVGSIFLPQ